MLHLSIQNKENLEEWEFERKVLSLIDELKDRLFDITQENFKNPNCIDGRDIDAARPSIPGWGLGALWVILAYARHTWEKASVESISKEVKKYFGGDLTGHSDSHQHNPDHQCQGCGHVQRLITQGERYQLNQEDSLILKVESNNVSDDKLDILEGEHEERNVFMVDIAWKGIKANGEKGQDFVYNIAYAQDLYTELSKYLKENLWMQINLEKLLEIANDHFMTTGWDLAKWRDVFKVKDINKDGTPELEHIMVVPV